MPVRRSPSISIAGVRSSVSTVRDHQAAGDGAGQLRPPLARRCAIGGLASEEIKVEPDDHRHQAKRGRHGWQDQGPQALRPGSERHRLRGMALGPQPVVGVDQHDIVVHDDAGECDPAHHDAERPSGHHQAEQDPGHREHDDVPIVLDPVMVAKGGAASAAEDAMEALRTALLPLATVVTPNLPEAARLAGEPEATDRDSMTTQAKTLVDLEPRAALVKGDILIWQKAPTSSGLTGFCTGSRRRAPPPGTHMAGEMKIEHSHS